MNSYIFNTDYLEADMNLLHLRYFAELAETLHYTRAAEALCITQPTLSHAINQLELELGLPLFEKKGRNVRLTYNGEQFLKYTKKALSSIDEGVDFLQSTVRGEGVIRLGLLRTLGVDFIPALAAEFLKQEAGKNIRFSFHTGVTGELLSGLSERKYDLVFASKPPDGLGFSSVAVSKQDLVLIVPNGHPLSSRQTIDLADTVSYPQVSFSNGSGLRDVIMQLYSKIGAVPNIAYETEEDQVVAGLVAQGFGIAVVPYMEMLFRLNIKILPIVYPTWKRYFYMVSDDKSFQSQAVKKFIRFVAERTANNILR